MTEVGKLPPPLPPRLDWFVQTQVVQLAQEGVPAWFHGAISREDAENLLELQPLGSFLIRVSHSHVGYTLSYKAQSCCHHFMVKLLDDGSLVIPGEDKVHASLDALVTFHQQQPMRPHRDLLTQPCGQKDPANLDYEDLFLYSNALREEVASPAHVPREHQNPSSCPRAAPEETSARLTLDHPRGRKPSAEMDRASTEEATSSCPPKAPLEKACRKLWRNLKMLPQTGKRVQQQLTSHLSSTNLSSLWSAGPPAATHSSGARPGDAHWEDNVDTDRSVATSLASPSQPQDLRDRVDPSRKVSRLASWSEATPRVKGWHQAVVRALSPKVSKPEKKDLAEPQKDWLPEEYRPPPPFAPGYC
ncbi:hematopoietic SH2 domain-containing protein [Mirounga leonina]|uniref:hematopoietic SH2 domain-containing protein n=1 Tax=Mirounga leonina TaxID=9715 RepID=UPI00156BE38E|nr:hematopoietic SH2 domain-containing protein [Mirounga leonina]XP_034853073.1 hematopoietic SH2 domain-containing protein [Mirounga leonina]XP_034853074.1 hematopoietic SH2 domain-containing protein [Mirounga leonina]